ncbi:hypothetical protein [Sediminibacillus massiliensis]|uniref:hypothetical protein n=1 Tax=Sediminibacillus massiliensis TaxID=1926277 RepID=UPI00098838EC|nr:hypothetical protein [Sediminibacillus massiliensis]
MSQNEMEKRIIEQYQQDENMMILVFAQWCVNNDLDPDELYRRAYPNQSRNPELSKTMELIVPKEESETIPDQTVLGVLQLFGNDDLAFVVSNEIEKMKKN